VQEKIFSFWRFFRYDALSNSGMRVRRRSMATLAVSLFCKKLFLREAAKLRKDIANPDGKCAIES
jgi:hypothetical protein